MHFHIRIFNLFCCFIQIYFQSLASLQNVDNMTTVIVYPNAATVFAAICACIFVVVGVAGKTKYIISLNNILFIKSFVCNLILFFVLLFINLVH